MHTEDLARAVGERSAPEITECTGPLDQRAATDSSATNSFAMSAVSKSEKSASATFVTVNVASPCAGQARSAVTEIE